MSEAPITLKERIKLKELEQRTLMHVYHLCIPSVPTLVGTAPNQAGVEALIEKDFGHNTHRVYIVTHGPVAWTCEMGVSKGRTAKSLDELRDGTP